MPNTTISPNMGLVVPTVAVDPGPDWATNLNASLSIIDGHDHSSGKGVPVTPAGLNINTDLTFLDNNAINLRSVRFAIQGSPLSGPSDLGCIYESGVDLYYNDGNGNQIQITSGGAIAGSPGSITGMVPPASVTYIPGSETFIFRSDVTTPANLDAGSIIIRNILPASNGITIQAPPALASSYQITLPTALPSSQAILEMSTTGVVTAVVRNSTTDGTNPGLGGFSSSLSSGFFTTPPTAFIDVTNLSTVLTTSGRPVMIGIQSDLSLNSARFGVLAGAGGPIDSTIQLVANSGGPDTRLTAYQLFDTSLAVSEQIQIPSSCLWTVAILPAAVYTFRCQIKLGVSAGSSAFLENSVLIAYEL